MHVSVFWWRIWFWLNVNYRSSSFFPFLAANSTDWSCCIQPVHQTNNLKLSLMNSEFSNLWSQVLYKTKQGFPHPKLFIQQELVVVEDKLNTELMLICGEKKLIGVTFDTRLCRPYCCSKLNLYLWETTWGLPVPYHHPLTGLVFLYFGWTVLLSLEIYFAHSLIEFETSLYRMFQFLCGTVDYFRIRE